MTLTLTVNGDDTSSALHISMSLINMYVIIYTLYLCAISQVRSATSDVQYSVIVSLLVMCVSYSNLEPVPRQSCVTVLFLHSGS